MVTLAFSTGHISIFIFFIIQCKCLMTSFLCSTWCYIRHYYLVWTLIRHGLKWVKSFISPDDRIRDGLKRVNSFHLPVSILSAAVPPLSIANMHPPQPPTLHIHAPILTPIPSPTFNSQCIYTSITCFDPAQGHSNVTGEQMHAAGKFWTMSLEECKTKWLDELGPLE